MKNMYLFHGSDRRIDTPRWDVGDEGRDFGKCFYTTYDRRTAKNWALKNFNDHQVVNRYAIDLERLSDGRLKIKRFEANAQWAEFVWNNRYNTKFKRPNYDIIIGPMADRGLKEQFIKMKTKGMTFAEIAPLIHYDRFRSMQVCFCSDYAIRMLNLTD